jgi:hypothetical protein
VAFNRQCQSVVTIADNRKRSAGPREHSSETITASRFAAMFEPTGGESHEEGCKGQEANRTTFRKLFRKISRNQNRYSRV